MLTLGAEICVVVPSLGDCPERTPANLLLVSVPPRMITPSGFFFASRPPALRTAMHSLPSPLKRVQLVIVHPPAQLALVASAVSIRRQCSCVDPSSQTKQ